MLCLSNYISDNKNQLIIYLQQISFGYYRGWFKARWQAELLFLQVITAKKFSTNREKKSLS